MRVLIAPRYDCRCYLRHDAAFAIARHEFTLRFFAHAIMPRRHVADAAAFLHV